MLEKRITEYNHVQLTEGLSEVFRHFSEVAAVFLFGSVADERAAPDSDLDLAVVPDGSGLRDKRLDLLAALARAGFDRVDLVFLDTDDLVLRYEAVRLNYLVYAREDFDRGSFYSTVTRQYFDFLPYLAIQRQAYRRRLLRDQA